MRCSLSQSALVYHLGVYLALWYGLVTLLRAWVLPIPRFSSPAVGAPLGTMQAGLDVPIIILNGDHGFAEVTFLIPGRKGSGN